MAHRVHVAFCDEQRGALALVLLSQSCDIPGSPAVPSGCTRYRVAHVPASVPTGGRACDAGLKVRTFFRGSLSWYIPCSGCYGASLHHLRMPHIEEDGELIDGELPHTGKPFPPNSRQYCNWRLRRNNQSYLSSLVLTSCRTVSCETSADAGNIWPYGSVERHTSEDGKPMWKCVDDGCRAV